MRAPVEIRCSTCENSISTIYDRSNHLVLVGFILTLAMGKFMQKIFSVESLSGYLLLSVVVVAILVVGFYYLVKLTAPEK